MEATGPTSRLQQDVSRRSLAHRRATLYRIAPVTHGVTDQTAELRGIRLTETSHGPHARIARHRHAYPAVTLVLRGGFLEDFGAGHTHDCAEMSVLVKPADAPHSNHYSSHGARSFIVECTTECDAFDALERAGPQPGFARIVVPLLELYAAFHARGPERQVLAEEVVFEVARQQRPQPHWRTASRPGWLSRIAESAAAGCTRPLSLTTLAADAGVHPVYLARVFRHHYAQSIGSFMLQSRLRLAMRRLAMTGEPIARIAQECGFADQSHLTRLLHRETGSTPARFRRVARTAARDRA